MDTTGPSPSASAVVVELKQHQKEEGAGVAMDLTSIHWQALSMLNIFGKPLGAICAVGVALSLTQPFGPLTLD